MKAEKDVHDALHIARRNGLVLISLDASILQPKLEFPQNQNWAKVALSRPRMTPSAQSIAAQWHDQVDREYPQWQNRSRDGILPSMNQQTQKQDSKNTAPRKLQAGVYLAARWTDYSMATGHQFVLCVPENAGSFKISQDLGGGTSGFVLAAADQGDRLTYFENNSYDADYLKLYLKGEGAAKQEGVDGKVVTFEQYTRSMTLLPLEHSKAGTVDQACKSLLESARYYKVKEEQRHQDYSVFSNNSNTWTQSLIYHNLGKGVRKADMLKGVWEPAADKLIHRSFFKADTSNKSGQKKKSTMPTKSIKQKHETTRSPVPGKWYVVQPNDTLSGIARSAYGDVSRYKVILEYKNNQISDPKKDLRSGMKIYIPK